MTTPDAAAALDRRRQLGVGVRADLISPADIARDVQLARTPDGVDLATVEGTENLTQCLSVGLTTLRGSDPFNQRFGFLGLNALTQQTSPVLVRESLRAAVAEFLATDPRVARITDLQAANPMAAPTGADRRVLVVQVAFQVITGDPATLGVGGLATGGDWGALPVAGLGASDGSAPATGDAT